ncbi:MAG: cupredoxin domain-containing protein [Acidimicrobiales bacterium]
MRLAVTTAVLAVVSVAALGAVAAATGGDGPGTGRGGSEEVRTVVLTVRHSRFEPDRVDVPVGTTVRFVVRNLDPIDHELIVGDEGTHRHHEVGREAHHHGEVDGEISVAAGATAVTTYRSATPGEVVFACHLPGHFAFGMVGTLGFE